MPFAPVVRGRVIRTPVRLVVGGLCALTLALGVTGCGNRGKENRITDYAYSSGQLSSASGNRASATPVSGGTYIGTRDGYHYFSAWGTIQKMPAEDWTPPSGERALFDPGRGKAATPVGGLAPGMGGGSSGSGAGPRPVAPSDSGSTSKSGLRQIE